MRRFTVREFHAQRQRAGCTSTLFGRMETWRGGSDPRKNIRKLRAHRWVSWHKNKHNAVTKNARPFTNFQRRPHRQMHRRKIRREEQNGHHSTNTELTRHMGRTPKTTYRSFRKHQEPLVYVWGRTDVGMGRNTQFAMDALGIFNTISIMYTDDNKGARKPKGITVTMVGAIFTAP